MNYSPGLDGLRALAILIVILFHSNPDVLPGGFVGVDLFFVLSGFLITGILLDARGAPGYFRAFYARRALRIVPAYYGFLAVVFLVLPRLHLGAGANYEAALRHQEWYWTHLTNVMMALRELGVGNRDYPNTLFWSLAVEEQFYLVWPLAVLLLDRRRLRALCIAGIVAALLLRVAAAAAGVSLLAVYVLPFTRMDTLLVGALLAVAARDRGGLERLAPGARWVAAGALAGLAVVDAWYGRLDFQDVLTSTAGGTLLALAGGATIVLAATGRGGSPARALFESAPMRACGRYSYAMYIVHTAVIAQLDHYLPFASLPPVLGSRLAPQALYFLLYLAEVFAVALVSWHLVEKRFLALKRFFPYGSGGPAGGA